MKSKAMGRVDNQEEAPFSPASLRDNWKLGDREVERLSVRFWHLIEIASCLRVCWPWKIVESKQESWFTMAEAREM